MTRQSLLLSFNCQLVVYLTSPEIFVKLALISYSHHGLGIARTARELGHNIVGVAEAEPDPLAQLVAEFGCPGFADARSCLDGCQADAVLVCGTHVEIPNHILACIERHLPFLVDKPFADCADRLRPVAEEATRLGVPNALALPNRATRLTEIVQRMRDDGSLGDLVLYGSRLCNGSPARYDPTPSYWHNNSTVSGGGCWATESSHGIDTFLQFSSDSPWEVIGAVLSNSLHERSVEDSAIGMIRTETGITGVIETGYTYPPGGWGGDHFFRFVGTKAQIFLTYNEKHEHIISVQTRDGVTFSKDIDHRTRMRAIIEAGLAAVGSGQTFYPDITQAVRILEIQDAVYAHARQSGLTNGPHPMDPPPAH